MNRVRLFGTTNNGASVFNPLASMFWQYYFQVVPIVSSIVHDFLDLTACMARWLSSWATMICAVRVQIQSGNIFFSNLVLLINIRAPYGDLRKPMG